MSGAKKQQLECLNNKYKVNYNYVLGEGSFARVYKAIGPDAKNVAVKVFNNNVDAKQFVDSVEALRALQTSHLDIAGALVDPRKGGNAKKTGGTTVPAKSLGVGQRDSTDGGDMCPMPSFNPEVLQKDAAKATGDDPSKLIDLIGKMNLQQACFVQLIDFSRDGETEAPGFDSRHSKFFMIYELGQESLADMLERHRNEDRPMNVEELRSVQWGLVSIACALHAVGYVHLDIKPANIMSFNGTWKLIDLDSVVRAQTSYSLDDLTCTVSYVAPEIAAAVMDGDAQNAKVSRMVDVWSIGMCALEAVILRPVMEVILGLQVVGERILDSDNHELSGNDVDRKMLAWLTDESCGEVVSDDLGEALAEMNSDMASLVKGMLARCPEKRLCISDCFVHTWFDTIRGELWNKVGEAAQKPSPKGKAGRGKNMKKVLPEIEESDGVVPSEPPVAPTRSSVGGKMRASVVKTCAVM